MTEAKWLAATDPTPMVLFLEGKARDRKFRLFACACCRWIWHLMPDEASRVAVEMSERFADGLATRGDLLAAIDRGAFGAGTQEHDDQLIAFWLARHQPVSPVPPRPRGEPAP